MKKQYLSISIAALFSVALLVGTSCSKKSSDNPAPATNNTPTGGGNTTTKPAAPNTATRSTTTASEGTGRPPVTSTPVTTSDGSSVSVLDQNQQRSNMDATTSASLDNVLGTSSSQLRMDSASSNTKTDFGWFVADVTVNGIAYSDQEIYDNDLQSVIFFNIDSSGYYWQYDIKTASWSWGTYGVDASMKHIAFDFDSQLVPSQVWDVVKATKDRFLIKGKFDIDGDKKVDDVVIGLNAYDLTNPNFSGETEVVPGQSSFTGNWQKYEDGTNGLAAVPAYLYIYQDGSYQTKDSRDTTTTTAIIDNGSWLLENIPGQDTSGTASSTFYLYPTYYDASSKSLVTDEYVVSIDPNNFMVMVNTNPNNPETLFFKRIQ